MFTTFRYFYQYLRNKQEFNIQQVFNPIGYEFNAIAGVKKYYIKE